MLQSRLKDASDLVRAQDELISKSLSEEPSAAELRERVLNETHCRNNWRRNPTLMSGLARQATIHETEPGEPSTIRCDCPLDKLLGYTTTLRSMTRGRGNFSMVFDRFDVA